MIDLSATQARAIALAAQGFGDARPAGRVDARHIRRVLDRVHMLQIDSVNVLVRAQYTPPYSRLGAYATALLDDMAYRRKELFEYWGRQATLLPVSLYPLMRLRMERFARGENEQRFHQWVRANASFVDRVYREIAARGALGASELTDGGERAGPWWGWAPGKTALEYLFLAGRVAIAGRRNFERLYDLTERVIPREVLRRPALEPDEAHREMLRLGARALGVGTAADLAFYFGLSQTIARPRITELVEDGTLLPARVEGWKQNAYVYANARQPRSVHGAALLTPFDSLVWERKRVERLFGFRYRIEIYVPEPKRIYGYYVLPFLMDDRLVGRVDLKADRASSTLLVRGAYGEDGFSRSELASALHAELVSMAGWLGLERIDVAERGDLAPALRRAGRGSRARRRS